MVDGDIIFNLSGTYDPDARDHSVSASSSTIRYTINGAFDASGNSLGSTATLAIKDGDEFKSHTYVVTVTGSAVNVDGKTAYENTEEYQDLSEGEKAALDNGGAPAWSRGWWTYSDSFTDPETGTYTFNGKAIASQWSFLMEGIQTDPNGIRQVDKYNYTIVEMDGEGSNYDVIVSYPRYTGTSDQVDAAFKDFLSKNGLSATKWTTSVNWETGEGFPQEEGVYYVVMERGGEWDVQVITIGIYDWSKLDKWYRTNYLETYLVGEEVEPETWYNKYQLIFNGDKSTMTATPYMDEFTNSWASISEAKAVTMLGSADSAQRFTR